MLFLRLDHGPHMALSEFLQPDVLNTNSARIVVVDDDRTTCLMLRRILQQDGYQVLVARNGADAIEICRTGDQDLILLDYVLPDTDGVNVCTAIRKEPAHAATPILVLTSRNDDAAVKAALAAGASDFITKPFLAPVLRQRVRHLVAGRRAEKLLRHMAYHDPLTGLANRALFDDRLTQLSAPPDAETSGPHAVVCLDLDRFKVVNDACGHSAGDELLRQLSAVLQSNLRQTDMLARLGGDEFAALLVDCTRDDAVAVAEKLRQAVSQFAFYSEGRVFTVGVSVGVAMLGSEVRSPASVLAEADSACYSAKNSGRNRVKIYEPGAEDLRRRRGDNNWRAQIEHALSHKRFVLSAQRIYRAAPGPEKQRHIDIQVHMMDEDGASIAPSIFSAPAERHGMMCQIDRWVLTNVLEVLHERAAWQGQISVCWIPTSGSTLADPDSASFIFDELKRFNIPCNGVCLQISEQTLLANVARASQTLQTLHRHGVTFAVDGFSGLAAFRALPLASIKFLKIDSSLLNNIGGSRLDFALVKAITDVARALHIETVAKHDTAKVANDLDGIEFDLIQPCQSSAPLHEIALREQEDIAGAEVG